MTVKVIFHVDESIKWGLALKNVQNLIRLVKPESSQIEVLANSEAVKYYVKDGSEPGLSVMQGLSEHGVCFAACKNALNGAGIPEDRLMPFVHIVPSGVLELAEKQAQGYAYIKP